jgi:hypothetical protein
MFQRSYIGIEGVEWCSSLTRSGKGLHHRACAPCRHFFGPAAHDARSIQDVDIVEPSGTIEKELVIFDRRKHVHDRKKRFPKTISDLQMFFFLKLTSVRFPQAWNKQGTDACLLRWASV